MAEATPETTTGTATIGTVLDQMLQELATDSGSAQRERRTWLEFNCQKGHHYARYATFVNGHKTRKIAGGGYVGDFRAVLARGELFRVWEYLERHDCHYPEGLAADLKAARLERFAPASEPAGVGHRPVEEGRGQGSQEDGSGT